LEVAFAGFQNALSQSMVVSYQKEPLMLAGSMQLERSASGANITGNALYDHVHRVAKVCAPSHCVLKQGPVLWLSFFAEHCSLVRVSGSYVEHSSLGWNGRGV
jgi:hypothetical protein